MDISLRTQEQALSVLILRSLCAVVTGSDRPSQHNMPIATLKCRSFIAKYHHYTVLEYCPVMMRVLLQCCCSFSLNA